MDPAVLDLSTFKSLFPLNKTLTLSLSPTLLTFKHWIESTQAFSISQGLSYSQYTHMQNTCMNTHLTEEFLPLVAIALHLSIQNHLTRTRMVPCAVSARQTVSSLWQGPALVLQWNSSCQAPLNPTHNEQVAKGMTAGVPSTHVGSTCWRDKDGRTKLTGDELVMGESMHSESREVGSGMRNKGERDQW